MKIDNEKIRTATKQYLSKLNRDEIYEYTEAIVDIAESCGYKFSDLWTEDGDDSELLKIIDSTLYDITVKMGLNCFD